MLNDNINGMFELVGSYFTWRNAYTLYRDKAIKGVYWPTTVFFTSWGVWNLFYYPSLDQWFSFIGGIFLITGNFAWIYLAIKYLLLRSRNSEQTDK